MTVTVAGNRNAQNGNGVTLAFIFPYLFLEADDLLVYVDGVLKTLTTDYSASGAGTVGGTVTFLVAPGVGVGNVVIINDPDRLQATALPSNGPFPSASVERMADKLTLIVQRIYDLITRSLRLSDSDPSTVSTQLPATAGNAGNVLRMNAAETALEYVSPGSVALAVPADGSVTRNKLANDVKSGTVSQLDTAFTTAGATPNFTLTPTPALAAYAAGVRYRVKFNAVSGAADNLNVSALGNKLLKQYNSAGAKVAAVFIANMLADVEYDGVDFVMRDPLPAPSGGNFQPLTAAAAANALTFTLAAGALLNFNDGTSVTLAADITLTVPNTALMGTVSGVPNRLWGVAMKNGGTPELAVRNNVSGNGILGIDLAGTITSTIMNTGSDSAQVWYSTTARASQPFCVVGFSDSTQAAAGVWATNPTKTQGFGPGVSMPGAIVQTQSNTTGAVATGSTAIPFDDTIPQIGEGTLFMTQAIVPLAAANQVEVRADLNIANAATTSGIMALFRDAIANALATTGAQFTTNTPQKFTLVFIMNAGGVASISFTVRAGNSPGNANTLNGSAAARLFAATMDSTLTVKEIMS